MPRLLNWAHIIFNQVDGSTKFLLLYVLSPLLTAIGEVITEEYALAAKEKADQLISRRSNRQIRTLLNLCFLCMV